MKLVSATAKDVTLYRLGGQTGVYESLTETLIGKIDVIRGFAYYYGVPGSAHAGFQAVVAGGIDGMVKALAEGVRNGRDDRSNGV